MHSSRFYNDNKASKLSNTIKKHIQEIKDTDADDLTQKTIARFINKLNSFKNSKYYPLIAQKVKNDVEKTIKKLSNTIPASIKMDVEEKKPTLSYAIQIPSSEDISNMAGMCAGEFEDQSKRLHNMVQKIQKLQPVIPDFPIVNTNEGIIPDYWHALFEAIQSGSLDKALQNLDKIPLNDSILLALRYTHSIDYLKKIIAYSIEAKKTGLLKVNEDIVFTLNTFEIFIKDLATTLSTQAKVCFSFGLPTHHAYKEEGAGFCIINKIAALIHHTALTNDASIKYIVIGTDVNRDDGLCGVLIHTASHLDISHVDIFDSRVYPYHGLKKIQQQFNNNGIFIEKSTQCFTKEQYQYYAVDLNLTQTFTHCMHPALKFALQKLESALIESTARDQKIALFLPTGWDSHKQETANCSKIFDRKKKNHNARFNDSDFSSFYEHLFKLYSENEASFIGVYWGLEGGYYKPMYENQIQLTLEKVYQHAFISCYADKNLSM